ncbi:MAG: hypothetical protein ABF991_00470 [Liquorilactobacillus hordei]|uniref:hypothetical protein n=1 Tax=Liquorilactobacillus hordei TaxID=468911 RepID=UPI0039EA68B9
MISVNLSEFIEYIEYNFSGKVRWYNKLKLKAEQKAAKYLAGLYICLLMLFIPYATNNIVGEAIVGCIGFIFMGLVIMEQRKSKKYSISKYNKKLLHFVDIYNQKIVVDKLLKEDCNVEVIKPLINEIETIPHLQKLNAGKFLSVANSLGLITGFTTFIIKIIYSLTDMLEKDVVLSAMLFLTICLFIVVIFLLHTTNKNIKNDEIPMTYILMILKGINISSHALKTNYYLRKSVLEKISEENKKKLEDLTKVLDTYMSSEKDMSEEEKDISKERKNMSEEEKKLFKEIKIKLEADNKKDL